MKKLISLIIVITLVVFFTVYIQSYSNGSVEQETGVNELKKSDESLVIKEKTINNVVRSIKTQKINDKDTKGSEALSLIFIERIRGMFLKSVSINEFDKHMLSFLNSSEIPREIKNETLWFLLSKENNSNLEFRYYSESLSTLNPMLLTPHIIDYFGDVESKEKKLPC